jgi:CspA family cold shock protein
MSSNLRNSQTGLPVRHRRGPVCDINATSERTPTRTGTVRWFSYSKGCGYIVPDDGSQDVFAHYSELVDVESECLYACQQVTYLVTTGPSGAVALRIRAA